MAAGCHHHSPPLLHSLLSPLFPFFPFLFFSSKSQSIQFPLSNPPKSRSGFEQHLLLGLIAESGGDSDGFLGSGITIDRKNLVTSASDLLFSISKKRVFEAAVEYSRTMRYNLIGPEPIFVSLFTVDDSVGRVLKRYYICAVYPSRYG